AVELDRMDPGQAVGEVAGQDPEPRADLEDDVAAVELADPADLAEYVLVDEEVLAEHAVGDDREAGHERPKAAVAFASIRASSTCGSSPRTSASVVSVWTTCA